MRPLHEFTAARVSLGVAGSSIPTKPHLEFRLAHARARDAVHFPMDKLSLERELNEQGWPVQFLHSAAQDRMRYLLRPDEGRRLNPESQAALRQYAPETTATGRSALVIADGLSALAVHRHAIPLLRSALGVLDWRPSDQNPIFAVEQSRVAIGDEIGERLNAELVVVLIGERPGLSSPDSLGIYLTWAPRRGRTDAERNCISNIHSGGLSYQAAAHKLAFLVRAARLRQLSGVLLKESAGKLIGD